jgi:nucleoside-triphosphatase THEP1
MLFSSLNSDIHCLSLPLISKEQEQIIEHIKNDHNIVVDSVAGSGKTTTILHIANNFSLLNILVITYNSKLRLETRDKINNLNFHNIDIHTYHSFCVNNYNNDCFEDNGLLQLINNSKPRETNGIFKFNYDIIIIDEAQDMTLLYFKIIHKIINDNSVFPLLCILGDINQSIFQFNGADERFIKYADVLFANTNGRMWKKCNLSTSYRITNEMSQFINCVLFKNSRISSNKISNILPNYIICNCFDKSAGSIIYKEIIRYINLGYKPDEIFVLAPSIKTRNSPITILENKLKMLNNIPIFIPSNDDDKIDDSDIMKNKLLFLSFHQSKGLERKVALIFNFDQSYFDYYNKSDIHTSCPNTIYVAITRASERITVFNHYKNSPFSFIDSEDLKKYCTIEDFTPPPCRNKEENLVPKIIKLPGLSVTQMLSFMTYDIIENCINQINKLEIQSCEKKIIIETKIMQGDLYENVSDITGTAMSILFEISKTDHSEIMLNLCHKKFDNKISKFLNQKYRISNILIQENPITIDQILYVANCWNSMVNSYLFKFFQIKTYDWISPEITNQLIQRFNNLNISDNFKCEVLFQQNFNGYNISGYVDCIDYDNRIVYEFKCVKELKREHFIQLAIYMFLIESNIKYKDLNFKYYIFNILTNELIQINCDFNNIQEIIQILLNHKHKNITRLNDNEFITSLHH